MTSAKEAIHMCHKTSMMKKDIFVLQEIPFTWMNSGLFLRCPSNSK